jgi:hypothetical protein
MPALLLLAFAVAAGVDGFGSSSSATF